MIRKNIIAFFFLFTLACASPGGLSNKSVKFSNGNTTTSYAIIVDRVFPNSPAKRGGLKSGDRILKVNGQEFFSRKEFMGLLEKVKRRQECNLAIMRKGVEANIALVPGKGRYRFGFRFKIHDPEIAKRLKFKIWPEEVNPSYKKFAVPYRDLSQQAKSSRSPQRKVLQHIQEILLTKGYLFTNDFGKADFVVKAEFKYSKAPGKDQVPQNYRKGKKLPFEALRIVFLARNAQKPFLKVSSTLDKEKARILGHKEYVYSILDAMVDKFPTYWNRKESAQHYAVSEKGLTLDQAIPIRKRFPGASPF